MREKERERIRDQNVKDVRAFRERERATEQATLKTKSINEQMLLKQERQEKELEG